MPRTRPVARRNSRPNRRARGTLNAIEAFFRSRDTQLARSLAWIEPGRGTAYTISRSKRALDVSVAIPLALIAVTLIAVLILVNRALAPRLPALFRQERVGRGRTTLRVTKIRSMMARREPDGRARPVPVCTTFGRIIRRYYLDELPQVFLVVTGKISLVGIRVLPRNVYDGLADSWSPGRWDVWQAAYAATPLGLTGAHQVFRGTCKEDNRRFHRDMFYARHATLGLDLYLLWRTLGSRDKEIPHEIATDNADRPHP